MDGGSIPPISTNRCHREGLENRGITRISGPFRLVHWATAPVVERAKRDETPRQLIQSRVTSARSSFEQVVIQTFALALG
jgi:hypothetical protein